MLNVVPIGHVRNSVHENVEFDELISEIEILPEYVDGLFQLEMNEEIDVIFWFDRRVRVDMRLHPKGDSANPVVGVFASRSPNRPNPIGVTRVRLLGVNGNIVRVRGLDAFDGTPVIDIKPAVRSDVHWTSVK